MIYAGELSPARHWMLAEHAVAGTPTVPGTAYLEMARAAWALETGTPEVEMTEVTFVSPLLVPDGTRQVRTVLAAGNGGSRSASRAGWQRTRPGRSTRTASCTPSPAGRRRPATSRRSPPAARRASRPPRCLEASSSGGGLVFWGPRWRSLRRARIGVDEALVELELPAEFAADLAAFGLHPALLDVATAFGGMMSGGRMLPGLLRTGALHGPAARRVPRPSPLPPPRRGTSR